MVYKDKLKPVKKCEFVYEIEYLRTGIKLYHEICIYGK